MIHRFQEIAPGKRINESNDFTIYEYLKFFLDYDYENPDTLTWLPNYKKLMIDLKWTEKQIDIAEKMVKNFNELDHRFYRLEPRFKTF